MRIRKADLGRRVKGDLHVEFTETDLTSYAGLELLIRYFRSRGLSGLLRRHLGPIRAFGDFGGVGIVRLLLGLVIVGGRRLRHVTYVAGDPVFHRLCGLDRLPGERTLSRWLKRFDLSRVDRLRSLIAHVAAQAIIRLSLRTLTLDVDGTVVSTGLQVESAKRGYNPHRRMVPSYYPITAHLAETGHILRVENRSGNVHDGKASITFLEGLFTQVEETLGKGYPLRFRMDGAFFQREILELLESRNAQYAIKVPFWKWLDLQQWIRARRRWSRVDDEVEGFEEVLAVTPWKTWVRVAIYRKRVHHQTARNYQLDLFDPDDGYYEYSAIASNLDLSVKSLWHFLAGRGGHERILGELKSGLAFDTVPTNHFGANSAWQQIVTLAHNLITDFQIAAGAAHRSKSLKRTALYTMKSIKTLRFELFHRAGQLTRPNGVPVLRLAANGQVRQLFLRMAQHLARAA